MNYFIIENDAQQGPFSVAELKLKGIGSDTLVWTDGMAEWAPAWQVEELRPLFENQTAGASVPPPPPISSVGGSQAQPTAAPGNGAQQPASRRRNQLWALVVLLITVVVLAVSNPSERAHKRAIMKNITNGLEQAMDNGDSDPLSQGINLLGKVVGNSVAEMVIDQTIEYHNYFLFSTTTLQVGPKDIGVSVGFLGNVFTADEDKVASAIKKAVLKGAGSFSLGDEDASADDQADPDQDVQVQRSEKDTTIVDEAGRAIGRAVVKQVTKTVKQKVNESTDSATSKGVGHIIDEVEKLINGN